RIVAAGDDTAAVDDRVTQTVAGSITAHTLTVVTLKGNATTGGGGSIRLATAPANTVAALNLFSCVSDGCPAPLPVEPPATGSPPTPADPVLSLIVKTPGAYANGALQFSGTEGGSPVNINGIGTTGDFTAFVNGSFNLNAFPFSANNVTVEAVGGDIILDLTAPLTQINSTGTGTLTFLASNDIIMTNRATNTIGTPTDTFDHHLVMKAGNDINLDNSIYLGARNLTLAGDAAFTTANQTVTSNNVGNVTLQGNHTVSTGGNVRVTGVDFRLLGGSTGVANATVQSTAGQSLTAAGAIDLMNSGLIIVRAGTANPVPDPADVASEPPASGSGARLQGATVNIGQAGGANNPKALIIEGGFNEIGALGNDPNLASKQADALVRSLGDMRIYLSSAPSGTTPDLGTVPVADNYSLVVRGGTAIANNTNPIPLNVTALASLQANTLTLETGGSIYFQGGTSDLQTANALAATNARLLVSDEKTIATRNGGSVLLIGGATTVDPVAAAFAGNTQAFAQIDPSTLTMTVDGILVLQGGRATGPAGSVASARIDAGDEIQITVNGSKGYNYGTGALGPASFYMIGGPDSGFFDKNNVDLAGSLAYPQAFPITVTLAGPFLRVTDNSLAGSVVQTGVATFDDSLLSYIIFATNDETRAVRILRRFDEDDTGVAACK
ncbi:MAG TPA: hypothetical protein VF110_08235, partial [Burkholderiales bacterium]